MGAFKELVIDIEDAIANAAEEAAMVARDEMEEFMHEKRDDVREAIEQAMLIAVEEAGMDMSNWEAYMDWADEDDILVFLDERASDALADEGLGEFV